jgi:acetyltransferase
MDFTAGEHEAVAQSGRHLLVRPATAGDEEALREMFAQASPEDVRFRAFGMDKAFARRMAKRLALIDPANETTLVGTAPDDHDDVLGAVHLVRQPDDQQKAEFDVLVRRDLKGQGVGYRLMLEILDHARQRGFSTVEGHILHENRTMLTMAHELGFEIVEADHGVVRVTVDLASPMLDSALRAGMRDVTRDNAP